jgi:hypothetical protein
MKNTDGAVMIDAKIGGKFDLDVDTDAIARTIDREIKSAMERTLKEDPPSFHISGGDGEIQLSLLLLSVPAEAEYWKFRCSLRELIRGDLQDAYDREEREERRSAILAGLESIASELRGAMHKLMGE